MATKLYSESAIPILENSVSNLCWSCGDMRAAHFCHSCGKVQPAMPTDYFSFFGLPRLLNIDIEALERDMYALSRKLHPDLYARSSEQERLWSLEQTSQLNDAYRALRDPIARTEYLLKLEGIQLDEQSKAATEQARRTGKEKKQIVSAQLLEEVFELNVQLEELREAKEAGQKDPKLLRELEAAKKKFQQRLNANLTELKGTWNEWDNMIVQIEDGEFVSREERREVLYKMLDVLNRRSYINNLLREVNAALAE
ncbi:MAG: Fe-S protein assembly co-chaperone HscB [Terriglobales bacterium]